MNDDIEVPDGWRLSYEETSNNVYKVRLTSYWGPAVETTGTNFEEMVKWCINSAQEINIQLLQVPRRPRGAS